MKENGGLDLFNQEERGVGDREKGRRKHRRKEESWKKMNG
uniref:Uncharacterized protein n=1 Tax=Nelumbo nucifera TaxID=4432 RepID=A0A822X8N0_NELNU|nr:TPA_asm: hypothetical protein HUJ06_019267 [Nelumbo nucifera]